MSDNKNKEKLILCQDKDFESIIKNAADVRNDRRYILDKQGKDLIASQYYYHRSCYVNYVNPKVLARLQTNVKGSGSNLQLIYGQAFNRLCHFIDETIINPLTITNMKTVQEKYVSLLCKKA